MLDVGVVGKAQGMLCSQNPALQIQPNGVCIRSRKSSGWYVQAMGRALLLELERDRHAGEGFLLCRQLASSSEFAVLTEQHLLCIAKLSQSSAPTLRWAVALRDVFHFDR